MSNDPSEDPRSLDEFLAYHEKGAAILNNLLTEWTNIENVKKLSRELSRFIPMRLGFCLPCQENN